MCGRARCTLAREEVAEAAGVAPDEFVDGNKYNPVENMGPGRYGPILLQCGGAKVEGEAKMKTRLQAMRWGLVPSFTKANAKPDHFLMFNARSENLRERPAFKRLLESKRCVVLCEGYYEWQQVDKREKQPYYFYREGVPMKFAGLHDQWKNESGELMCTYTILTTAVAPELKWLHTRMPVILSDEGVDRWLSGAKFEDLKDLLASYRSADLKWHPVDRKVGSMQFQSEDCAKKVNIKHAGDIKAFFGVKTEKQEPKISSPATSGSQIKPEEETCSDTAAASPPSKKEEHDSNADTTPKKEFEQFPTKFVPASALLNKHSDDEYQDSPPSKSPSKRRRLSSPTKSKSPAKKSKQPGPKQSSLDFFFGKARGANKSKPRSNESKLPQLHERRRILRVRIVLPMIVRSAVYECKRYSSNDFQLVIECSNYLKRYLQVNLGATGSSMTNLLASVTQISLGSSPSSATNWFTHRA